MQSQTKEYGAVDMNAVLKDAIASLEVLIKSKNAEINQETLPTIRGEHQLLVQLMSNLIKNAIVHNDKQIPAVTITGGAASAKQLSSTAENQDKTTAPPQKDSSTKWVISIRDNGPDIAPELQEKIFEMFHRAGKNRAEGNGIGLALCSCVAKQHGTTIGIQSRLGEGSTFYFDLASTDAESIQTTL